MAGMRLSRRGVLSVLGVEALALAACSSDPLKPTSTPSASSASAAPTASDSAPLASASADVPVAAPEYKQPDPPNPPIALSPGGKSAVKGEIGLVTSVEANATKAGVAILEAGGNAIDAAVTVAFCLAVTHPSAGNIGGGGFMVIKKPGEDATSIDFRETAPKAATTKKVLDEIAAGAFGWASTAVPGTVAGLVLAREKFGTKPLADLLAPAIKLAKGHKLAARAATVLGWQWNNLKSDATAKSIFGGKGGKAGLQAGDKLVQKDLAKTLEAIAASGSAGFYEGKVAGAIADAMKKGGGDVTMEDLAAYSAVIRKPLQFSYRGFEIATMPPPSMGGIAVAEMLLEMERLHADASASDSPAAIHCFVEAAKRAYADRRLVGADPMGFEGTKLDDAIAKILSPKFRTERKPAFDPAKATPAKEILDPKPVPHESPETTHFSVIDKDGVAVSCTVTLSASFGAKVVVPKTGVLLSNALGAFSASGPNEVAPGKRMASSMSPTIVSRNGRAVLVVGSPGGDTIPNTTVQVMRNLIDYRMTVDDAVTHGRVHHQLDPDEIRTENLNALPEATLKALRDMGHTLKPDNTPLGDAKIILIDEATGASWGFADTREGGLALGVAKPKSK
jgi:gamma-glutamyltranspeptidase/glutathione hydrolase